MDPKKFFAELTRRNVCKIARKVIGKSSHGYGKRFIVRADEKLTAFLELETAIRWH
jgi:hypothetical protein